MNSLLVALIAFALLAAGYFFYGGVIRRLWNVDPERPTPAKITPDSVDYIEAKHWSILFGHHFSSIAGAGPILGPVIACALWGWVPAVIWIVLGSILIGGVHDFSALMASIRNGGRSVADLARNVISPRAKLIFACFLWLALVLVIAQFAFAAAKALVNKPEIVLPTFGLIFIAVLVGAMIYRWGVHHAAATVVGIVLLFGLILLGMKFPLPMQALFGDTPDAAAKAITTWTIILLVYGYIASVLPVNFLLQPRDHLATFVLYIGLGAGIVGIAITHPPMHAPATAGFSSAKGPLWPMMGVFIACGAISGFHGLVAAGTTSKQIASEAHAQRVGYGAMLLEGVLAVVALLCVSAGLYWVLPEGAAEGTAKFVYPNALKEGWLIAFARGYGRLTQPIFGVALGTLVGMTVVKTFIMTTLDTATRIGRYISEEILAVWLPERIAGNRFLVTAVMTAVAVWLALGAKDAIWPVFGASNQLVASLIFIVITSYLFATKRPTLYTLIPGIFMLVTTLTALGYQMKNFILPGEGKNPSYFLGVICVLLIFLAAFMCAEATAGVRRHMRERRNSEDSSK